MKQIQTTNLNGVTVWENDEGKFGLRDELNPNEEIKFRYRTLERALEIARMVSDENNRIAKYEESTRA